MADRFEVTAMVEMKATIRLTEPEIRALSLLASYGTSAVVNALSEALTSRLGESLYATGISTLLDTARNEFGSIIKKMDAAREVFHGEKK